MKEAILRDFFIGTVSAEDLTSDLRGAILQRGFARLHPIEDMWDDFEVKSFHLIKLCDAVLEGKLEPRDLEAIEFCLLASDHFQWNGDDPEGYRVAEVAADWSCPIINYSLNCDNVKKWRSFLQTGVNPFVKQVDREPTSGS